MTKVTIDETTYSVTVAEENVNVTVADATETIQIQIASGASLHQVLSSGGGNSLVVGSTGGLTTLKSLSAGDNVTFSDDGNTITISSTEDDLSNNTTDDLAEGTTNLYYTDARVDSSLASVTGNIIPSVTDTYTLGSPTHVWQDLYLGQASLYIDGTRVIGSDVTGDINITTDPNQNIHIAAGQNVVFQSVVGATDQTFEVELDTINLGKDVGGATVTVRGTLEAPDLHVGDLELDASGIQQTAVGQNLTLKTSGTGFVYVETADFYVGDVNTSAVKIDENSISRFGGGIVTIEGFTNSADMTTAINTAETNANTYTDTREIAITTAYQAYADQSEADAITTSNSYADTAIANLVDSAPATLDTLNELAAALGDDPNFATTVTNSIATKWTQDNTKISNWDTAYSWGDHSVEGYLTSYTETDPIFTGHVASSILSTDITNWNTAYGWGDHSIVGYITDYTVTEADVTQHQAALSITESQISDLTHYTDSDARTAISLTSSNLNELSYDNTTGVITYVSPTTVAATGQVVFDVRNASGVDIARGDAVYIAGHSGGKVLVAKADANAAGEHPAFGLANSAMLNNSDGTVLTHGEMLNVDTSAFAVNDTLYLSETAGELTATRPSSETTAVQNIGKVARSDNQNGIIVVAGSGRENDVPNLATGHVFIGNGSGYDKRALTTSDVSEGSNLYYTDARVQTVIDTNTAGFITDYTETDPIFTASDAFDITATNKSNWNTAYSWGNHADEGYLTSFTETDPTVPAHVKAITTTNISNWDTAYGWGDHSAVGYITDYTVTQADVTQHQAALSITESQITDLTHYTNAQAITAVQNEATLDLTGDVTIAQDLDVTGLIKVNDGYTISSFDPYSPAGLPSTAMPTTIMGIGQEEGWAGLTIRSRGEHAWGLTGFGIPNEKPRALLNLSGGRLDGSSDDYLNNADNFGSILFNPYSGYKTGTEWLTPSAYVEAIATEDHSSSGMGTKLVLNTTENGNQAGAQDASHTNKSIEIQGTTISTSETELIVDDNLKIVGSGSSNTVIGDALIANTYATHGFKVNADDTNWAGITLEEYVGAGNKPLVSGFANATVAAQVIGGTPSAKTNVISGKRLLTIQGLAANQSDGTLPQTANFRIKGETTEDQTTSNRGTKLTFETTANGSNNTTETLKLTGNQVTVNSGGDGYLNSGGDLYLNDDVTVTGTLNVNGNVTLGDANTDTITATGKLKASNGFGNTVLDVNTANYLSGVLGIVGAGDQAYISDGNGGTPCMAFYDGSNWKRMHSPTDNISST
jgi:hypothetical protein